MIYRIVCAWCGKDIGTKECPCSNNIEELMTHSICKDCEAITLANIELLKKGDEI